MEWSWWRFVMLVCGVFGMSWIILASNWLSARGLEVSGVSCAWDAESRQYVARLNVRNTEEQYKVAEMSVQGRFKPPAGQSWPHPTLRAQYAAVTQPVVVALAPNASETEQAVFAIPGTEAFECSAKVRIGRQERFETEPSHEVLDAVTTQLGQRSPSLRRGFRRRGF